VPGNDETDTLGRAKAGDRKAFDALQTELQGPVWRFVDRLIGPSGLTPDVVQKAFLALYLNIEKIASAEHLRPFLYRVARNLCYDELRWQGRFEHIPYDSDETDPAREAIAASYASQLPDEMAHVAGLYAEVLKALDRLPELQRQTLVLYVEEDLTYEQVAQAMNTDIGTVKSRIHNGRRSLLKHLKPEFLNELGIGKENHDG
jgi:RNA polymerase sigma-70 factor (ECF subfamily)